MDFISPNSPAYYLTSVAKDRLPVFRQDTLKSIACSALNEARNSGGFLLFAYVIMPDHIHVITDGEKKGHGGAALYQWHSEPSGDRSS
jgi:REP element-mobilizing transposase RayT